MLKVLTEQDSHGDHVGNIIKANPLTILYFYATWCVPCKSLEDPMKEYSELYPEIMILKIDVGTCPNIAKEYNVKSVPAFLFIKQGEIVASNSGSISSLADVIKDFVN